MRGTASPSRTTIWRSPVSVFRRASSLARPGAGTCEPRTDRGVDPQYRGELQQCGFPARRADGAGSRRAEGRDGSGAPGSARAGSDRRGHPRRYVAPAPRCARRRTQPCRGGSGDRRGGGATLSFALARRKHRCQRAQPRRYLRRHHRPRLRQHRADDLRCGAHPIADAGGAGGGGRRLLRLQADGADRARGCRECGGRAAGGTAPRARVHDRARCGEQQRDPLAQLVPRRPRRFPDAQQSESALISARNGLLQARSDQATALIQLYLALGGGWDAGTIPTPERVPAPSTPGQN
ncbi:hypothetical protein DdX_20573 [Ditylenchus destructor]|uniref:Uncharacterized protein n=1 Tax=Ditylenchus destructor TaxID=166010 RepID=A0AAD4MGC3_9BILA|nr:hypothetical protein DdX_20573 [Ditylenchus destructor]